MPMRRARRNRAEQAEDQSIKLLTMRWVGTNQVASPGTWRWRVRVGIGISTLCLHADLQGLVASSVTKN
jgi:hypothetical protein